MTTATAVKASEIFDQHASLVIDTFTFNHNEILRDLAERIMSAGGCTPADVTKTGMTVYRNHAVLEVFEKTADGERVVRHGELVKRIVTVQFGDDT